MNKARIVQNYFSRNICRMRRIDSWIISLHIIYGKLYTKTMQTIHWTIHCVGFCVSFKSKPYTAERLSLQGECACCVGFALFLCTLLYTYSEGSCVRSKKSFVQCRTFVFMRMMSWVLPSSPHSKAAFEPRERTVTLWIYEVGKFLTSSCVTRRPSMKQRMSLDNI